MVKKERIIRLVVTIVVFTVIFVGCNKEPDNPVAQNPQNSKPSSELHMDEPQVITEITDEAELENLWQEYFYDSIATISNCWEFNTPEEIDPENVAMFCWLKYKNEQGKESLSEESENSFLGVFPLETVLEYAKRYFNLETLDVSEVSDGYYDPQKQVFTFNFGSDRRPSYTDKNSWGVHLDKVTRNSDGSITAVMVSYDTYENKRPELITTLTLKQREDGSFYFTKGKREFVNNHLVTIAGEYKHFDKISGFARDINGLSMLGEIEDSLIFANISYNEKITASLMLVNADNLTVEKELSLNGNLTNTNFKLSGEKIIVLTQNKIVIYDKNLEQIEEVAIPKVITDKIKREPKINDEGINEVVFGGYDVSSDMKRFVYSDEIGVKLINTEDNSEKLLAKTVIIPHSKLIERSYHWEPRFVAQDSKVITTRTGYECTLGYTLCDLNSDTTKMINISEDFSSTGTIRYDTGILEVNACLYDEEKQTSEYKTLYLDFMTGVITEVKIADTGETGEMRGDSLCYVGQNYAAFVTNKYGQDYTDNMYYINRLNLSTLNVEPQILSVKAAETKILGILSDGRIVVYYNYNPSERGICITK